MEKHSVLILLLVSFSFILVNGTQEFVFNTIYLHPKSKEILNSTVAVWKHGDFEEFKQLTDSRNRSNLLGIELIVGITFLHFQDGLNDLNDLRDRNKDALSKHNYGVTIHIMELLNITPKYHFYSSWGSLDMKTLMFEANSTLGELQRNISEFSGSPCFVIPIRIRFFDFVAGLTPTIATFMFRAPPLSAVSNIFYLPFDLWVWYSCMAILVVIFIIVYIIISWEWSDYGLHDRYEDHPPTILRPKFWDVVQMEIGGVCQQGSEAEPKSTSGQIATFVIFLSMMFLYTAFSACIVALLQSRATSLNSLTDLLNSNIDLGVEDNPYMRYFVPIQTGELQRAIVDRKIKPTSKNPNFFPSPVGVEKMRKEFFGFFAELDTMYKLIAENYLEEEKCGLVEVPFWTMSYPWIPMRKGTQYKELVKVGFNVMIERGIRSRSFKRFYAEKPRCVNQGASFTSVSINDCYFALVAYILGVFISIVVFGFEHIYKKIKSHPALKRK